MRIGINTLSIAPSRGGAKTFVTNLARSMARVENRHTYVLFVSPINKHLFGGLPESFQSVSLPLWADSRPVRILCEQLLLPYHVARNKIDVLLSPGNVASLATRCKQVLVLHGPLVIRRLRRRYAPKEIRRIEALFHDLMLPLSVKRSAKTIAVSQDIKEWLLKQVRIDRSKVVVVHEGVDFQKFYSAAAEVASRPQRRYVLFLSTLFRYKNADKAIRAFALMKQRRSIPEHELLIVGRDPGGYLDGLRKLVNELGLGEDTVRFLGAVPHKEVPELYRGADVFLYPSTVESFGLPPLEAMASGTPVIASNRCSVPEIVGDAGLIVDPDNVEALAEAILRVLKDQQLRQRLVQRGYKRAEAFTWEKAARETLDVLEEVGGEERLRGTQRGQ